MSNNKNQQDHIYISPMYLKADPAYQRVIDAKRVNAIARDFNEKLFNEPKVSKREDGYYYVIDGDHSVMAHQIKFGKDAPIKCKVFYGLTREEEMEIFVHQHDHSKKPTNIDKIRALKNFNDPQVQEWIKSTEIVGLKVDFDKNPGDNKISAPDTAFQIYKKLGKTGYINVLTIIMKIWDGDEASLHRGILKGFAYIYKNNEDKVKVNEMVASLSGYPVKKIEERAKVLSGSLEKRFAIAISEQYNKRRRQENKIVIM